MSAKVLYTVELNLRARHCGLPVDAIPVREPGCPFAPRIGPSRRGRRFGRADREPGSSEPIRDASTIRAPGAGHLRTGRQAGSRFDGAAAIGPHPSQPTVRPAPKPSTCRNASRVPSVEPLTIRTKFDDREAVETTMSARPSPLVSVAATFAPVVSDASNA